MLFDLCALGLGLSKLCIRGTGCQNIRFGDGHQLFFCDFGQGLEAIGLFDQQLFEDVAHAASVAESDRTCV